MFAVYTILACWIISVFLLLIWIVHLRREIGMTRGQLQEKSRLLTDKETTIAGLHQAIKNLQQNEKGLQEKILSLQHTVSNLDSDLSITLEGKMLSKVKKCLDELRVQTGSQVQAFDSGMALSERLRRIIATMDGVFNSANEGFTRFFRIIPGSVVQFAKGEMVHGPGNPVRKETVEHNERLIRDFKALERTMTEIMELINASAFRYEERFVEFTSKLQESLRETRIRHAKLQNYIDDHRGGIMDG